MQGPRNECRSCVPGLSALPPAAEEDIKRVVGQRLSAFKVPTRVFVTEALPKGPTGKISRRFMVDAFINKKPQEEGGRDGVAAAALPAGVGGCWC